MKKLVQFQCEICEHFFETEELAIACENKGIEEAFAKEGQLIKVKTKYSDERAGRIVKLETKRHEKIYTIGIFPESYGMHYDNYVDTFVLKGNKKATERIIKVFNA